MKYAIYTLTIILLTISSLTSQTFDLQQNEVLHEEALVPSIEVVISPDAKEVKKAWKDFIQDNYDADVDGIGLFANKDILVANQTTISSISEKQMDLYAKIIKDEAMTRMNVFGSLGYDIYLNPKEHSKAFDAMETIVSDFLTEFLPNYFSEVVEASREQFEDDQDEVKDIEEKIAKNKAEIEKLTKENLDLEKELIDASQALDKPQQKLKTDKYKLEKVKDKVANNSNK